MGRLRDDAELLKYATPEQLDWCERQIRTDFDRFVKSRQNATHELADDCTKERAADLEQVVQNLDMHVAASPRSYPN